ncbi:MAG: ATP-binding protein [Thermoguttaceae bacterium]
MNRQHNPADGERNAISGYDNQYRIAASLILNALIKRTLTCVRIADPRAERVDDFQIEQMGTIDAYQIKWSRFPGSFTYSSLTTPNTQKNQPSIISQLASGWKRIKETHHTKQVFVHFVTNDIASSNGCQGQRLPSGRSPNLAAFIAEVWNPMQNEQKPIPDDWQDFLENLRKTTELTDEEFYEFARFCKFDFGWKNNGTDLHLLQQRHSSEEDIQHIKSTLFTSVASPERIIEMSRAELVKRLGWQDRVEMKNVHAFPRPILGYCEIAETVESLQKAIEQSTSGYLALIGTPGAGKSTLVSNLFHPLHRIIHYYSYVPNAETTGVLRGESDVFLHDLVLLLQQHGIVGHSALVTFEREVLLSLLSAQLGEASENFRRTGRKTVIVLDGLDHIPREQNPQRSFLEDLYPPNDVPKGVIFLLSTQTIELAGISAAIKEQLKKDNRTITLAPIPRSELMRWLSAWDKVALSPEQIQKLFELTGGHPLAIYLVLNEIAQKAGEMDVDSILGSTIPFSDNVTTGYESLWDREIVAKKLTDEKDFLAKIARLRNGFDKDLARLLASGSDNVIEHFLKIWQRLFLQENGKWMPFHNSIIQFLREKTSEDAFGDNDPNRHKAYHAAIAVALQSLPVENTKWWDLAFHLCESAQYDELLKMVTVENVIAQSKQFRPLEDVKEEILLGFRACKETGNYAEFVRLIFVMLDLEVRSWNIDGMCDLRATDCFINMLGHDKSLESVVFSHIFRGSALSIHDSEAFIAAKKLKLLGYEREGKKIYELAEPWRILKGGSRADGDHSYYHGILIEWAKTAPCFRSFDVIESMIVNLKDAEWAKPSPPEHNRRGLESDDIDIDEIITSLFFHAGATYLKLGDMSTADKVREILVARNDSYYLYWFYRHLAHDYESSDNDKSLEYGRKAIAIAEQDDILEDCFLDAAEYVFFTFNDKGRAKKLFERVSRSCLGGYNKADRIFDCFRYFQMLCAFGDSIDATKIIPTPEKDSDLPLVLFERALLLLANLKTQQRISQTMPAAVFLREIKPLLNIFQNISSITRGYSEARNDVINLRNRFLGLIVETVAEQSDEHLAAVANYIFDEWQPEHFPDSDKLEVLRKLWKVGYDEKFCRQRAKQVAEDFCQSDYEWDTYLSYANKFADVLAEMGNVDEAKKILGDVLFKSYGIAGRKDYQMERWLKWLDKANEEFPDDTEKRIRFALKSVLSLKNAESIYGAANLLIKSAYRWKPEAAFRIAVILAENGVVDLPSGLQDFFEMAAKDESANPLIIKTLVCSILMPICTNGDPSIIKNLLARTDVQENTKELAQELFQAASTLSAQKPRAEWLEGVKEHLPALFDDENNTDEVDDEEGHFNFRDSLVLESGNEISKEDAYEQAKTVERFLALVKQQKRNSYFLWHDWFESWLPTLSNDEIYRVQQELSSLNDQHSLQILCLERLTGIIGDEPLFEAAHKLLLERNQYSNGLLRSQHSIDAAKMMISLNSKKAHPLILEAILDDIQFDSDDARSCTANLEILQELVVAPVSSYEIWTRIESYLQPSLNSFATAAEVSLCADDKTLTANETLMLLVEFCLDHPIFVLSAGCMKSVHDMLKADIPEIHGKIKDWLSSQNEGIVRACLVVLQGLCPINESLLQLLLSDIQALTYSRDIDIRMRAVDILLQRNGMLVPAPRETDSSLLKHYSNQPLVDSYIRLEDKEIKSTSVLEDSFDPRNIVGAFTPHVECIAHYSSIPMENLLARIHQIMRELEDEPKWNKNAEMDFRQKCDSMGCSFTFRRLKTYVLQRAILHVSGELVDAGKLAYDIACKIYKTLLYTEDYDAVPITASIRPSFITPPEFPYDEKKYELWCLYNFTDQETKALFTEQIEDWHILAERTVWKSASGLVEKHISTLVPEGMFSEISETRKPFINVQRIQYRKYHRDIQGTFAPLLVMKNQLFDSRFFASGWFAFNSQIAEKLGLTPAADDGLFAWKHNDEIVAKSTYWMDGHPHFHSRYSSKESPLGIGWLVLVKERLLRSISISFGELMRFNTVARSLPNREAT